MALLPQSPLARRAVYGLSALLIAGILLCWLAPHCVNKKALNKHLRQWIESSFAFTMPVGIETVDVAIRAHGRTDLYLQEVECEAPNPAFAFPWLQIPTIRASAPFYELWGGIRPVTEIRIRHPLLRLQWDENGHGNIDGLRLAEHLRRPFQSIDLGDFTWKITDGTVRVEHPLLDATARVNGSFSAHTIGEDHLRVHGFNVGLSFRPAEELPPVNGHLHVRKGAWHYENAPRMPTLEAEMQGVPLRLLNLLLPGLPVFPANATVGGTLTTHAGETEFSGEIHGNGFQVLPKRTGITWRRVAVNDKCEYTLRLRHPGHTPLLPLGATPDDFAAFSWENSAGRERVINGAFPKLDLREDPRYLNPEWTAWLTSLFDTAHFKIGEVRWESFSLRDVALDIRCRRAALADVSAECVIAGGKMLMRAQGLPLNGGVPQSFHTALDVPALGDTLLFFSGMLPPLFHMTPLRGSGQITLRFARNRGNSSHWELRLALQDVAIPTLNAGETLQALSGLKTGMKELENMTRRAAVNPLPPLPAELNDNDETLKFSSILACYTLQTNGPRELEGLEAASPQIGKVTARGQSTPDGAFRLTLQVREVPEAVLAPLSPAVRRAALEVLEKQGLRLECLSSSPQGTVERQYIQDIFRQWLENAANSRSSH